jgi:hypothetical protein
MENEDARNRWERAFKYEGIHGCQNESTGVNWRVVTRRNRVVSRVPLRNKRRLLISVYVVDLRLTAQRCTVHITRANNNEE